VDLDPSMKSQTVSQTITLTGAPAFDQTGYLLTFRTESPLDFYKTQLQAFLDTNAPNYVPEALARNLEITPEFFSLLIGQPPYVIKSVTATYTEIPDTYRQKFTLTIEDPVNGADLLTYTVPISQIIGKRLTLSYAPATAGDAATITAYGDLYTTPPYLIQLKPQIKLEGAVVAEGSPIGSGKDQRMTFLFNTTLFTEQVENTVIAGEYYAMALNAQVGSGGHEEVFNRSQRLAAINDTIKLNDPTTLDDRLGELLYLTAQLYHHNLNMSIRQIAPLHNVVDIREVSEMMYFLTVQVDDIFGAPLKITPVGITGDMDRDTHLIIPVDGDLPRIKPYMQLVGNQSSYLEHSVTEGVYQTDAVSAVKGLQLAYDQGIPVHTITIETLPSLLPLLQLSPAVEAEIQNAVNAGKEVIVPERNLTLFDWTGVGYIVQNPVNGEGAYRISGGVGGVGIVREALIRDLLVTVLDQIASQAHGAMERLRICFPGPDNQYYNFPLDDVCYTEVTFEEIEEDCGTADPGCRKKYAPSHGDVARPLIDSEENGLDVHLTKNITARQWRSQDLAKYMRTGFAILTTVEELMAFFTAKKHGIDTSGSGYRTQDRNDALRRQGNNRPSLTSHHMDGVAADIVLSDFVTPPDPSPSIKCQVLFQASTLVGQNGAVKDEGTPNSVHISIPTKERNDVWNCP
jgi:hypothetical protein